MNTQLILIYLSDLSKNNNRERYNPSFRAHISSRVKLPIPVGYYPMIKPGGQSFLGGGLFADTFKDAPPMVRDYIAQNGRKFENIVLDPEFEKYFLYKDQREEMYQPDMIRNTYKHNVKNLRASIWNTLCCSPQQILSHSQNALDKFPLFHTLQDTYLTRGRRPPHSLPVFGG